MPFEFEKLVAYQKSVALAEAVCVATRGFPRDYLFLANQLNRAAVSIAANIAEGSGRFTMADRRRYFGISRGSTQECVPLLEIAVRRQVLNRDTHARLMAEIEQISRLVAGLIRSLDRRRPKRAGSD
jgi:four helix bundle protein